MTKINTILILRNILEDMEKISKHSREEVLGLLTVKEISNYYLIADISIPEQYSNSVLCYPTVQGLEKVLSNLYDINSLRGWFHNHPHGISTWSLQDEQTILRLVKHWGKVISLLGVGATIRCRLDYLSSSSIMTKEDIPLTELTPVNLEYLFR